MPVACKRLGVVEPDDAPFFRDLPVHAVTLDRYGIIVTANDRWKQFAEACGMGLPNYGVGESYLRHCAFADPASPRLIKGLSQLLAGQTELFSFVYSCHSPTEQRWFLMIAFPDVCEVCAVAVLHIDISTIVSALSAARAFSAHGAIDGATIGEAVAESEVPRLTALIERSMASSLGDLRPEEALAGDDVRRLRRREPLGGRQSALSRRQQDVLALITDGLTNAEIARRLGLSENTVKIHVSGILARLGFESRAQVMHWALTRKGGAAS